MSEYVYASSGEPLANSDGEISLARREIVRCRDCMYYKEEVFEWVNNLKRTKKTCDLFDGCYVKLDGFCAWGERRER